MISTKTILLGAAAIISLDVLITLIAVGYMGAPELNPFAEFFGFFGFMSIKVILSALAVFALYKYYLPIAPCAVRGGALTICGVFGTVCSINLSHIFEAVA
jgi:hypothetical protein